MPLRGVFDSFAILLSVATKAHLSESNGMFAYTLPNVALSTGLKGCKKAFLCLRFSADPYQALPAKQKELVALSNFKQAFCFKRLLPPEGCPACEAKDTGLHRRGEIRLLSLTYQ